MSEIGVVVSNAMHWNLRDESHQVPRRLKPNSSHMSRLGPWLRNEPCLVGDPVVPKQRQSRNCIITQESVELRRDGEDRLIRLRNESQDHANMAVLGQPGTELGHL